MKNKKKKKRMYAFLLFLFSMNGTQSVSTSNINNWYYDNWCGSGLQYLTDSQCMKKFPSKFSRNWNCPIINKYDNINDITSKGYDKDKELSNVDIDINQLGNIVTNDARVCAIITKRVEINNEIELYHKYFCAGNNSKIVASETWSR